MNSLFLILTITFSVLLPYDKYSYGDFNGGVFCKITDGQLNALKGGVVYKGETLMVYMAKGLSNGLVFETGKKAKLLIHRSISSGMSVEIDSSTENLYLIRLKNTKGHTIKILIDYKKDSILYVLDE